MIEVTLELDDNSVVLCSVAPATDDNPTAVPRSTSAASRLRRMFSWRSEAEEAVVVTEREMMKMKAKMMRNKSSAQRALGGMGDSKEFALGIFDALERRRRQKTGRISKAELHEFWLQISDASFDARLQIFFDMADINGDGKITRDEVQELIMLSASANKLSDFKERANEYASLIMEELDPEHLGYIELWQLEALLLQRDNYMNYSRPLSTTSMGGWSQNIGSFVMVKKIWSVVVENWQRGWILMIWILAMAGLFTWKFIQYRQKSAFHIMGYCLTTAKGAAETLKLNMALILLPVCRNILTWLRSTRARVLLPLDDNINMHKMIAFAIAVGVAVHGGIHLMCDFPRIVTSSPEKFALIASDFEDVKPTYISLLKGVIGVTGIAMVVLMTIAFTLATRSFRRNAVKLPPPFNTITGFNAFWYSHHLLAIVYVLLLIHGTFLFLVHGWYKKTIWMYISIPLLLYVADRSLRTCRSEHYAVRILKVSVLPGGVFSLIMGKPDGFTYKSGQYIFLQCPAISSFEWHPFSLTSAPGDDYLSLHIRTVGDWTKEVKRVFTEDNSSTCVIGRAKFGNVHQTGLPKLLVDGPYGAPAQDYQNYDVLLLVGLGIGATPFISILRDLLNSTRQEDQIESNTETSRSDDSSNSVASSYDTLSGKKKLQKIRNAHFYWVTRECGSFEWFKGVMNEVAEMDHKGQIEMHNYLTSVYEEGDARSTLITMVQALSHAKNGVDILSGTRVRTHFARPNWKQVFYKVAAKHPCSTVGKT
ncbi:hypothetical protein ACS0TY_022120 [Phlomoides rotata]